jgi:hypothetical protein
MVEKLRRQPEQAGERKEQSMQDVVSFRRGYLIGAAIVWVAIILVTVMIPGGTPYFGQMLPILAGGAAWFVVIIPGVLYRVR